jgi:hypothetical protein
VVPVIIKFMFVSWTVCERRARNTYGLFFILVPKHFTAFNPLIF